jgi:hypothetical protein
MLTFIITIFWLIVIFNLENILEVVFSILDDIEEGR